MFPFLDICGYIINVRDVIERESKLPSHGSAKRHFVVVNIFGNKVITLNHRKQKGEKKMILFFKDIIDALERYGATKSI